MYLIGVAGGSGSGKTTFAQKIISQVQQGLSNPGVIATLHQDSYYKDVLPPELISTEGPNFDHPDAFDWDLLKSHLKDLKRGIGIEVPLYDFKTSRRIKSKTQFLQPTQVILIEGIYTLWDREIRELLDIKVFLYVDADVRFIRRLHRDVKERGRSIDSIIKRYYDTVRPMHHNYLEPTRQFADLVVGDESDIAANVVAARVKEEILR
jgi:uridine kinase